MPSKSTAKPERVLDADLVEALRIARSQQQPGQTKEQTKLIAQGIAKGIAQYRRVQSAKARERDRQRKRDQRVKQEAANLAADGGANPADPASGRILRLAWWSLICAGMLSAILSIIGITGVLSDSIPSLEKCIPSPGGSGAMLLLGAMLALWFFRMAHHLRSQL